MSRRPLDFYPTPSWATVAALARLESAGLLRVGESTVFDPACGDGALLEVARARGLGAIGAEIDVGRIAATRAKGFMCLEGDGTKILRDGWSCVVMNPPYSHASDFVRAALLSRPQDGFVAALMRLSWLEPVRSRRDLLGMSPDVWLLPRRPKFTGRGADSMGSAWFVWPGSGHWSVLDEVQTERLASQRSLFDTYPSDTAERMAP